MHLMLLNTRYTLNGASLEIMTALLCAMRVFKLYGFHQILLTRMILFQPPTRVDALRYEALHISTENTAVSQEIQDDIQEQLGDNYTVGAVEGGIRIILNDPL